MTTQPIDAPRDEDGQSLEVGGALSVLAGNLARAGRPHPVVTQAQQHLKRVRQDLHTASMFAAQKARERASIVNGMAAGTVPPEDGLKAVFELEPYHVRGLQVTRAHGVLAEVRTAAEHQVYGRIVMAASDIWASMAAVCAECVAAVRELPDPGGLYQVPRAAAADEAARQGYSAAWAVHLRETDRFTAAHKAAMALRPFGDPVGVGYPGGAPRGVAVVFKNWWKSFEGNNGVDGAHARRLVHPTLRLRWAIDRDWQPGLWTPAEVPAAPPEHRKKFLPGIFRTLGSKSNAQGPEFS